MTTVTQRNRKNAEEDPESHVPEVGGSGGGSKSQPFLDKASRIAANLARLDAAPALMRPTQLWKGYSWRFARNSGDGAGQVAPSDGATGASDVLPETWREWTSAGFRRRSCYVMTVVSCSGLFAALCCVLALSTLYAWAVSRDPCLVQQEMAHELKQFPRKSNMAPDYKPVLPKIIHQQWKTEEIPETYKEWHQDFRRLYPEPEYKHMLWTDVSARELIQNHFPFFLETYNLYKHEIQRADAARYFILYMYGGLYADLDYEPLSNFWDQLPKDRVALIESPYLYNEKAQNAVMSSPIADPFWNETFALLIERSHKPVLQATGPMFLDALMKHSKETFALLPCENFQRLPLHLSSEEEVSPFMSQLHREVLGRLAPMKSCGDYHSPKCQYGKHHNTASYLGETGVINLLWT